MTTSRKDRKNGKYRVRMSVGGTSFDKSFTLLEDAKKYEAKLRREKELVESGLGAPQEKVLIMDRSATWLAIRKKEVQGPSLSADEKNLRLYILPYMGTRPFGSVTTFEWRNFLEFIQSEEDLSNATHNRIRSTLQAIYKDAVANGIVNLNPIDGVPRKSEKSKTRKTEFWHTDEEILTFLEATKRAPIDFRLYAFIALNAGPRISEICALQWRDVEFNAGVILLNKIYEQESNEIKPRTKSGEGIDRYIPINPELKDFLIAHKGKLTDRIVKLNPDEIARLQDKILGEINPPITRVTPHGLRKTFATWYRRHGGTKDDLQAILGHSSPMVTDIYAKTTKQSVANMSLKGIAPAKNIGENVVEFRGERK